MNSIEKELAQIEERLIALEEEQSSLIARKQGLHRQSSSSLINLHQAEVLSIDEKVALFSSLFKGLISFRYAGKTGKGAAVILLPVLMNGVRVSATNPA